MSLGALDRRATALVGGLAVLVLLPAFVDWTSTAWLHTLLEVCSTAILCGGAVLAMARYYKSRAGWVSVLGIGLWGTGLLDAYHTVVTSPHFSALFVGQAALIAWSWLSSRVLLAVILLLALWTRRGNRVQRHGSLWAVTGGMILGAFLLFALAPLPPAHWTVGPLGRPQELFPAALYLGALVWVWRDGAWRSEGTDRWLCYALLQLVVSQALLMTRSQHVFDAPFDLSHAVKVTAHASLVVSVLRLSEATAPADPESPDRRRLDEKLPRLIAWQFALIWLALATAAVGSYFLRDARMIQLEAVPRAINVAGKQRLHLARIHRLLLQRPLDLAELEAAVDQLEEGYSALLEVSLMRDVLEREHLATTVKVFAARTRRVAGEEGAPSAVELAREVPDLIRATDALVSSVEKAATEHASATRRLELLLLLAIGLLLFALAVFVVWPLLVQVRVGLHALQRLLARSEEVRDELDVELRRFFELSQDMISVADLTSGVFLRANPAFERTLGYPLEVLLKTPFLELIHPEDIAKTQEAVEQLLAGKTVVEFQNRYRTLSGDWRWLSWTVTPTPNGKTYAVARDVTDMLEAHQLLEVRALELERSNRALDDFAYVASHDLRAPLRDIDNLATWIAEDALAALPPESQRHLNTLVSRIGRMEMLLEDLLQYSRAGRKFEPPEEVDVLDLLQGLTQLVVLPDGFELELPQQAPTIVAPRAPLEVVLRNLIQNAFKHHDRSEGKVTVSLQDSDPSWLEFRVADDGPGIPARFHERVFRLFQSLKPRDEVETSGMGLAIVKRQVEAHGGRVGILPTEGERGCTFFFTWPRAWRHEVGRHQGAVA